MKTLQNRLYEGFYKNAGGIACHPTTKRELQNEIRIRLERGQTNLNDIDTSRITDMSSLFQFFNNIQDIDISGWDVSKVKDMNNMFLDCRKFNCDLSKWDVSSVEDMSNMFFNCKNFNSDLSKWNVSKVTDMRSMFYECPNFNCDLSGWNVNKVRYMDRMFKGSGIKEKPSWCKDCLL